MLVYTYKVGEIHPTVIYVCKVGNNNNKELAAVISAVNKILKLSPRHAKLQMVKWHVTVEALSLVPIIWLVLDSMATMTRPPLELCVGGQQRAPLCVNPIWPLFQMV